MFNPLMSNEIIARQAEVLGEFDMALNLLRRWQAEGTPSPELQLATEQALAKYPARKLPC